MAVFDREWVYLLSSFEKSGPLLVQTCVLVSQRCFLASLVEIGSSFLDMSIKHVKTMFDNGPFYLRNAHVSSSFDSLGLRELQLYPPPP